MCEVGSGGRGGEGPACETSSLYSAAAADLCSAVVSMTSTTLVEVSPVSGSVVTTVLFPTTRGARFVAAHPSKASWYRRFFASVSCIQRSACSCEGVVKSEWWSGVVGWCVCAPCQLWGRVRVREGGGSGVGANFSADILPKEKKNFSPALRCSALRTAAWLSARWT